MRYFFTQIRRIGYADGKVFDGFIATPAETAPARYGVLEHEPRILPMKNDPIFKFVAVILVVGVFLAMISAAHSVASAGPLAATATVGYTIR